jgi:hypothetical protein
MNDLLELTVGEMTIAADAARPAKTVVGLGEERGRGKEGEVRERRRSIHYAQAVTVLQYRGMPG